MVVGRKFAVLVALILLGQPVLGIAQPMPPTEVTVSELPIDLNGNGEIDRATIIYRTDFSTLLVLEESASGRFDKVVAAIELGICEDCETISKNEFGGFTISEGALTFGSTSYRLDYHISYRDGDYWVAGATSAQFSRLTTGGENCDVNLLSGRVEVTIFPGYDGETISNDDEITIETMTTERAFKLSELNERCQKGGDGIGVCDDFHVSHRMGVDERPD